MKTLLAEAVSPDSNPTWVSVKPGVWICHEIFSRQPPRSTLKNGVWSATERNGELSIMHSNPYTEVFALASNPDLLYLFQREHIRGSVVELGSPRGGVGGDGLRLFDCPAVFQVGGDSGGTAMPGPA